MVREIAFVISAAALLIAAADEMLYRAKHPGRNQVQGTRCGNPSTVTALPLEAA